MALRISRRVFKMKRSHYTLQDFLFLKTVTDSHLRKVPRSQGLAIVKASLPKIMMTLMPVGEWDHRELRAPCDQQVNSLKQGYRPEHPILIFIRLLSQSLSLFLKYNRYILYNHILCNRPI